MARRSDHSRDELKRLVVLEGHRHMAEVGYSRFSAREVAKRIGYTVNTVLNAFGSLDQLVVAINTRTFVLWASDMSERLERGGDPVAVLVEGYFGFARENRHLWNAIYDHHLPPDQVIPEDQTVQRGGLTAVVVDEIAKVLPTVPRDGVQALARSLIATVHGHCALGLGGSLALMGEKDPQRAALDRVRDSLSMATS